MRTVTAFALAFASLLGATSAQAAITAHQAAPRIKAAAMASPKVVDKGGTFRSTLGPAVRGNQNVRSFSVSNIRTITLPFGGPGAVKQGSTRVMGGGTASGTINLMTEKVSIKSYVMPR